MPRPEVSPCHIHFEILWNFWYSWNCRNIWNSHTTCNWLHSLHSYYKAESLDKPFGDIGTNVSDHMKGLSGIWADLVIANEAKETVTLGLFRVRFDGHLRFGGHFGPFLVISSFVAISHSIQHEKIYKIPNFHKVGTKIIKTSFSAAILDLAAILEPFWSFLVL